MQVLLTYRFDLQLFLSPVNVEQRGDAHQQPPPGPVPDEHELAHVALDATHGEVLQLALRKSLASQLAPAVRLQADHHSSQLFIPLVLQLSEHAAPEEYLKQESTP